MRNAKALFLAGAISILTVTAFIKINDPLSAKSKITSPAKSYARFANYPPADNNDPSDFTVAAIASNAVVHVEVKIKDDEVDNPISQSQYNIAGSGVIFSSDGLIITNNHVIKNALSINVTLADKKSYHASLIGADAANDIAVLKINANNLPVISFSNSDVIRVGDWVLAIGYPWSLDETITAGIISAKSSLINHNVASIPAGNYLQTDAAINLGNSGGALVNTRGELVGITAAIASSTGVYIGYGYAIPANTVYKVVQNILLRSGQAGV